MPFQRHLAWSETQATLPRIWTWVADSIYYNDKRYTKLTQLDR